MSHFILESADYIGFFSQDRSFEEQDQSLPKFSSLYTVGEKELQSGQIWFINGINNTLPEAMAHAQRISELGNGVQVRGFHNQTHGIGWDSTECTFLHTSRAFTPPSFRIAVAMRDFHDTYPPQNRILLIGTSGGMFHIKNALLSVPREIQQRVTVLGIAPGTVIPKNICFDVQNYATASDGIVKLARALNFYRRNNIQILPSHPDAPAFDHSISSPSFVPKISNHVNVFIENSGRFR